MAIPLNLSGAAAFQLNRSCLKTFDQAARRRTETGARLMGANEAFRM